MPIWKRHVGVLGMVLVLIGICSIGVAQVDVTFPWTQPGAYTGNAIDFGAVPVGQTKTATYKFKILETSATSATVTITRPNPPFGSGEPVGSFTLAPGQSITFDVTFTPPAVGHYTGSFTITAQGGRPVVTKRQTVTLTGSGTSSGYDVPLPGTWGPTEPDDVAKLEAKLDEVGVVLAEFREKLDNLGWWLGKLTVGWGIGIEPHSTNPIPQTNTWEQLAKLEAKLDRLLAQPGEITIIEVYNIIVQINVLIVNFNQLIVNIGGDVAKLETKLDQLDTDLVDFWLDFMDMWDDMMDMWTDIGIKIDAVIVKIDDAIVKFDAAIVKIDDAIVKFDAAIVKINDAVVKLDAVVVKINAAIVNINNAVANINNAVVKINVAVAANAGAIAANGAAIAANARALQALQDSNNRIEDKLNQLLGFPAAPDAAKITLTMGGGPQPAVPWEATVEGISGAVQPNALVTIYWPIGAPPSPVTADANGAFSFTMKTGSISYHYVEVTQTVGGKESARVRVPAS